MCYEKYYFNVLKTIVVIAVVFYHFGMCEYDYLGVDIFLVIAGYFTCKSIGEKVIELGGVVEFLSNRFSVYDLFTNCRDCLLGMGMFFDAV